MNRKLPVWAVSLVILMALVVASCGEGTTDTTGPATSEPASTGTTVSTTTASGERVFTLEELAKYDGKDGRAAYAAVDGVVYDVSGSQMWPEGVHGRCGLGAEAGRDLSEVITKAPSNMRALLERMPVVGKLAQ